MQPRRLVVLAGGVGSRLRRKADPKPLARLGGLTLIERAVAGAAAAGFEHVVVVTGHRADEVRRHVLAVSRERGVPVTVVHNERYREGNGLSALAARSAVGDEPFALVMADHVFPVSLLRRLRTTSVPTGEIVVCVDPSLGRATGVDPADAMKVLVADGRVRAIGKRLPVHDAFDIGAFVCSDALFGAVEAGTADGDSSLAGAVQLIAERGAARVLPIDEDEWWFDVDTPRDHRNGRRQLVRRTGKPLDGTVAAQINRRISQRVVTPALLALWPGVTPNQVTLVAFGTAVAAAAAMAAGAPVVAAALVALASVLDGSDGEVARLTHRTSRYGGFLDAVLDRAADGLLFTGVAVLLATDARLGDLLGGAQAAVALWLTGTALVGHLLVSYTTAKAAVDLGHRYRGRLLGGGHGRDLRLLVVSLGALGAAVHPVTLLGAMIGLTLLTGWIVTVRLRSSWWTEGTGRTFAGVRAVALDFDGTVADSMGFLTELAVGLLVDELGFEADDATRRYRATTGLDFRTQLEELAPGDPRLDDLARRFEEQRGRWMDRCTVFDDVAPALRRLRQSGVPVLLCSSTRVSVLKGVCARHGLLDLFSEVDGWRPDRPKSEQLAVWVRANDLMGGEVLFVGDSRRDAEIARTAGTRFLGLARPGRPDEFSGTGIPVVASLTDVADGVARARRSPVVAEALPAPVAVPETGLSGVAEVRHV